LTEQSLPGFIQRFLFSSLEPVQQKVATNRRQRTDDYSKNADDGNPKLSVSNDSISNFMS